MVYSREPCEKVEILQLLRNRFCEGLRRLATYLRLDVANPSQAAAVASRCRIAKNEGVRPGPRGARVTK